MKNEELKELKVTLFSAVKSDLSVLLFTITIIISRAQKQISMTKLIRVHSFDLIE